MTKSSKYEKEIRPILDQNERTVVDFQFSFTRIVVNEKQGTLETNGWLGLVSYASRSLAISGFLTYIFKKEFYLK